jgi:Domain of unknown function (DUF4168)
MDTSNSRSAHRYRATLALILPLVFVLGVTLSQKGNADQSNPGYFCAAGAGSSQTIDDATLKRTAKAFVKIRRIVASAQQAIERSNNEQQTDQIVAQAELDEIDAVKATGLQTRQYNQVMQLARADTTLRKKLFSYVNELEKAPPTPG